jgi:hypothetical protein
VRLRIHRGTREIGGTCIELESDGAESCSISVFR